MTAARGLTAAVYVLISSECVSFRINAIVLAHRGVISASGRQL